VTTDFVDPTKKTEPMDYLIETHRWQDMGGRALIEQRFLSITGILQTNMSCQPYVNGRIWDVPFTLIVPPEDYPDPDLRETEYQGYSEFKPVGNYIHYVMTGQGPATIYSIMLNALIQRGVIATTFDPFGLLKQARTVPDWITTKIEQKDAGDEDRDNADYEENDAGDMNRDNADYGEDDAGDQTRSLC
jgi:hypothetical protein